MVRPDWRGFGAQREEGSWKTASLVKFLEDFCQKGTRIGWKLIEEVGQDKFLLLLRSFVLLCFALFVCF